MAAAPSSIRKVLFLAPEIAGGGAERVVTVLSNELVLMGIEVDLILYDRRENEYPLSDKVRMRLLPKQSDRQSRLGYLASKYRLLRQWVKESDPDVLIPFLSYQVEHGFAASRGLGIPFVTTVRNNPYLYPSEEKRRKRRDFVAAHSQGIFLQCEEQREYFPERLQRKCFTVLNPVDGSFFDRVKESTGEIRHFMTAGRLQEQKGQTMLIDAFALASNLVPGISLDIYGEGPLRRKLQDRIDALGMSSSIRLCGRTEDAPAVLAAHDAFILSSEYEGLPNALMEAMAVGLPCISTACKTGPRDLLGDDERGYLVPVGDAGALSETIAGIAGRPGEAYAKGRLAAAFIRDNCTPSRVARQLLENLEGMC